MYFRDGNFYFYEVIGSVKIPREIYSDMISKINTGDYTLMVSEVGQPVLKKKRKVNTKAVSIKKERVKLWPIKK